MKSGIVSVFVGALLLAAPVAVLAEDLPRATFSRAGTDGTAWSIQLDGKKFLVSRDGAEIAGGSYEASADQVVFRDEKGPFADKAAGPGKYRWTFDGKKLLFEKLQDASASRGQVLTAGAWEKK